MIKQQQLLWNGLVLTRDQVPKRESMSQASQSANDHSELLNEGNACSDRYEGGRDLWYNHRHQEYDGRRGDDSYHNRDLELNSATQSKQRQRIR